MAIDRRLRKWRLRIQKQFCQLPLTIAHHQAICKNAEGIRPVTLQIGEKLISAMSLSLNRISITNVGSKGTHIHDIEGILFYLSMKNVVICNVISFNSPISLVVMRDICTARQNVNEIELSLRYPTTFGTEILQSA
ncbi:hypothetical protein TNCV_3682851 [Trichonephila clavipes]|uniref:Uncharacterized protein n=1 Tax=Trichonephila clavipes TaxID=2585209 RepID=A0A8X6RFQ3_TRICX|nr:hypothetical protein TNCV_3682851 [Trichonephila clavipes]